MFQKEPESGPNGCNKRKHSFIFKNTEKQKNILDIILAIKAWPAVGTSGSVCVAFVVQLNAFARENL